MNTFQFIYKTSLLPDGLLDEVVGLEVNCGRGLVEDENLGLAKQGSGETNKLSLPDTEINKISLSTLYGYPHLWLSTFGGRL